MSGTLIAYHKPHTHSEHGQLIPRLRALGDLHIDGETCKHINPCVGCKRRWKYDGRRTVLALRGVPSHVVDRVLEIRDHGPPHLLGQVLPDGDRRLQALSCRTCCVDLAFVRFDGLRQTEAEVTNPVSVNGQLHLGMKRRWCIRTAGERTGCQGSLSQSRWSRRGRSRCRAEWLGPPHELEGEMRRDHPTRELVGRGVVDGIASLHTGEGFTVAHVHCPGRYIEAELKC